MTITLNGTTGITTPGFTNTGTETISSGTANGVAYLNGSNVLTTGTALVFDGTNLGVGVTPKAWSSVTALQIQNAFVGGLNANAYLGSNAYYNGSSYIYNTSNYAALYFQSAGQHIWYNTPSGTAGATATFIQAMTLDASGNLAIGTTSPGYTASNRVVVAANSTTSSIFALMTGGTNRGYLYADSTDTTLWSEGSRNLNIGTASAGPIVLTTNNSERMRVDPSGNVGIGVTPSAWTTFPPVLQIKTGSGSGSIAGTGPDNFRMMSNVYYDGSYKRYAAGYATMAEQSSGAFYWYNSGTSTAGSAISWTTALSLNNNGNLALQGGASSNGIGITFPAAQSASSNANCLDDYEEGTWTPTVVVASGTVSYTRQQGSYTKVGNVVHVWGNVVFTNSVSGTGLTNVAGLPFTVTGYSSWYPGPAISNAYFINLGTGGTVLGGYWYNNDTTFKLHSYGNNTDQLSPLTTGVSMEIRFEGMYTTA